MTIGYTKVGPFVDDSSPYLNAANLNTIEQGIKDTADAVDALGSAAEADTGDFATAAQGSLADSAVQPSTVDAKGDLLVGTADNTVGRLPVGSNGQVLVADSGEATGLKFADAPSGGGGGFLGPVPYSGEYMFNAVRGGAPNNSGTPTVGTLYCTPYYNLGAPFAVDRIAIHNGSAGGTGAVARLGAYTVGSDGRIGDLIFDAGTTEMISTGDKNITIDEVIPTGVTLLCMVVNDSACRPRRVGSNPNKHGLWWRGWTGPLSTGSHSLEYTGYDADSALPSVGTTAGETLISTDAWMIAVRAA